jgi:hypothetical protein
MSSIRPRTPSASLVISILALIVALGGTAYAGITLHKNSVGTKQLKKNSVTAAKLANGAVTGAKLTNGAITNAKVKNGAITAAKLNTAGLTVPGALHATTANSATTATNAVNAGSAGALRGVRIVESNAFNGPSTSVSHGTMNCPAGQYAISGGAIGDTPAGAQFIESSYPNFSSDSSPLPNQWDVDMYNTTGTTQEFTVLAVCASGNATSSAVRRRPAP